MNLIIVESPTKARTFNKFLDSKKFVVASSAGHIRDLPKNKLGVDIDHDFSPSYEIMSSKKKTVNELIALAKKAHEVILATDLDREGEAIAYHLSIILTDTLKKKPSISRITFHEITHSALEEALEHPRKLNKNLFDAQQARRVLDRIVGYKVSPYLWKRFSKQWLSAGRVQSVALRFVVERERERARFNSKKYFGFTGLFTAQREKIEAKLIELLGKSFYQTHKISLFDGVYQYKETTVHTPEEADTIMKRLKRCQFMVFDVTENLVKKSPPPPFTTSTLQQFAANYLGFSAGRTMRVAQSLYEQGLISYHRTDSFNMSEQFIKGCRSAIQKNYGVEYLAEKPRRFKTTRPSAQEAHEAIRPTNINKDPENLTSLRNEQLRLYEAIYTRAVATQMKEALIMKQKLLIRSSDNDLFRAEREKVQFLGFLILDKKIARYSTKMSALKKNESLTLKDLVGEEKETTSPPYYTEASLIKTLEERGIGRPSTYAPILTLIQERQYVKKEGKSIIATELGMKITDVLVEKFSDVFDIDFTASMEQQLDEISTGEKKWQNVVAMLYQPLAQELDRAYQDVEKIRIEEKTDEVCPDCSAPLVIKLSRFGKFYACSRFPDCKYTKSFLSSIGVVCPKCGKGDVVVRFSKKRKRFYACNRYPDCDYTSLWPPKKQES